MLPPSVTEGYSVDEQLSATAGKTLSDSTEGYVTAAQAAQISGLVDSLRNNLYASQTANIVQVRTAIATLLRSLLTTTGSTDAIESQVLALSGTYGDLDGENNYACATVYAQVYATLTLDQWAALVALLLSLLSGSYSDGTAFDYSVCTTPFLYFSVITDTRLIAPYVDYTDYLFFEPSAGIRDACSHPERDRERHRDFDPNGDRLSGAVRRNLCVGHTRDLHWLERRVQRDRHLPGHPECRSERDGHIHLHRVHEGPAHQPRGRQHAVGQLGNVHLDDRHQRERVLSPDRPHVDRHGGLLSIARDEHVRERPRPPHGWAHAVSLPLVQAGRYLAGRQPNGQSNGAMRAIHTPPLPSLYN